MSILIVCKANFDAYRGAGMPRLTIPTLCMIAIPKHNALGIIHVPLDMKVSAFPSARNAVPSKAVSGAYASHAQMAISGRSTTALNVSVQQEISSQCCWRLEEFRNNSPVSHAARGIQGLFQQHCKTYTRGAIVAEIGILSFEMDIIQPQCATKEWGFAENLYIQLSYPAFLFLLQGGWCGAIYLAFRKQSQGAALPASAALPNGLDIDTLCPPNMSATLAKMRMNGKSISDFPSMNFSGSVSGSVQRGSVSGKLSGKFGDSNLGSIGGSGNYAVLEASGWWLFLQTLLYIPSTPQEMHELILENMSIAFMSLNLGYVVILKYCLQAFSCFDFEGTKYMYFNADELCYTPEHFQIMTAAAAGLIVYIAGTWFMFITVMRVLKQTNSFCGYQLLGLRQKTTASAVWVDV
eukprot:1138964-Pelagomonas_calceolata.AAC.1